MFSKANKQNAEEVVELAALEDEAGSSKRAAARTRSRSSSRPASSVPSIVSGDMIIRGSIESAGEVQFDGEIDGDIRAKRLVVGDTARVSGEVVAEKVRVAGTINGHIRALEVELASTASVTGDITHKSLTIESGARFEGNCQHADDPMSSGGNRVSLPRPKPAPTRSDAAVDAEIEPVVDLEPASPRTAQRFDAPRRELMPARTEPSADRAFVKRPAKSNLR